jgi:hypothetical protein
MRLLWPPALMIKEIVDDIGLGNKKASPWAGLASGSSRVRNKSIMQEADLLRSGGVEFWRGAVMGRY